LEIIKVKFGFFWPDFNSADNYFTRVLSSKYQVVLSEDPDIYFFTHDYNGCRDYLRHKCHRVFLGWENMRADWNACDYVLDSDYYNNNPRHKRYPIWAARDTEKLTQSKKPEAFLHKKKFACMVVSNGKAKERIHFFHLLNKYKKVDSGGKFLNNIGRSVVDKMEFIKEYKFVLSFENSCFPGYTTEKLIEPMLVNSIPIYWGNERVDEDFNSRSFIHVNKFSSYEAAIEHIIEMDKDEQKYLQMAMEPWFHHQQIPPDMTQESLEVFFDFIVGDIKIKTPVATSFIKSNIHKVLLLKKDVNKIFFNRLGIFQGFR
jgi:alpha(1,3/1,4) fucosyltransferase